MIQDNESAKNGSDSAGAPPLPSSGGPPVGHGGLEEKQTEPSEDGSTEALQDFAALETKSQFSDLAEKIVTRIHPAELVKLIRQPPDAALRVLLQKAVGFAKSESDGDMQEFLATLVFHLAQSMLHRTSRRAFGQRTKR